jgi:hypothetical protein
MLTREYFHDIKNHLAIAIGMTDLTLRTLKKDPSQIDVQKIIDRGEKTALALEQISLLINKGHRSLKKD